MRLSNGNEDIAQELKCKLLYESENDGAVKAIAEILNLTKRTVYDYLDGRIKISLPFLHAAVIATGGDPDVKKFLEPKGWQLVPSGTVAPDKGSLAEECLDDLPCLAEFHRVLCEPKSRKRDIDRAKTELLREIQENIARWKADKKTR